MRNRKFARLSATLLLAMGFAAGVVFVSACGGSTDSTPAYGATAGIERHVRTIGPQSFSGLQDAVLDTTFVPADPNDVVLRVRARGTWSTSAGQYSLSLSVSNGAEDLLYARESALLLAGTDRPFNVSTSLTDHVVLTSSGVPDGAYRIKVLATVGAPGFSIDFGTVVLEVITLKGVTVLDPSPSL